LEIAFGCVAGVVVMSSPVFVEFPSVLSVSLVGFADDRRRAIWRKLGTTMTLAMWYAICQTCL